MTLDKKLQYLYASLADLQSSIRAIDTKVGYLLVLLFIPLTRFNVIFITLKGLLTHGTMGHIAVFVILETAFTVFWILGFWVALRTIIAIDNPKNHIDGERPDSQFYPAHLFRLNLMDVIWHAQSVSTIQFNKHYACIPQTDEEIAKHLTLEQMKAMYIVSVKLKRSVFAYYVTITWVIFGGVLWLSHLAGF